MLTKHLTIALYFIFTILDSLSFICGVIISKGFNFTAKQDIP